MFFEAVVAELNHCEYRMETIDTTLTSATAVQLLFHKTFAMSASVLPTLSKCFLSHLSPTSAWLCSWPFMGPMECFEVMRSFDDVRGAMKMMQPLDFRVNTYGGVV